MASNSTSVYAEVIGVAESAHNRERTCYEVTFAGCILSYQYATIGLFEIRNLE